MSALSRAGVPITFTTQTIKGIAYAFFPADTGDYVATYEGAPPSGGSQSIWPSSITPAVESVNESNAVELGVKFRSDVAGTIRGIRFYKGSGNTGTHVGTLWSENGTALGSVTFTQESPSGWQEALFTTPVAITAGTTYVASYLAPNGGYAFSSSYFGSDFISGNLRALSSTVSGGNGVYKYGGGFPNASYLASNYWVDVLFDPATVVAPTSFSLWPSTTLPSIQSFGDTGAVQLGVKFTAARAGLVSGIRFFKGSANSGTHTGTLWSSTGTALATATFNNETATGWQEVRFASPVPVSADTTYVASYFAPNGGYAVDANYFSSDWVSSPLRALSSSSAGGNGVYRYGGGFPDQSFNNTNYWVDVIFEDAVAVPDYSLWSTSSVPTVTSYPDSLLVELGVKVQAARNGEVLGVRFYKGANNTGTHVAHLWDSAGGLLGSASFANETATGWQEVRFTTPVPVVAGQIFVVSYLAPNGGYAVDGNFFGSALVSGPLTALASSASGGNGVYKYGGGFPDQSYNAANYWVDVLFR